MADEHQLLLLRQGVEAWNRWRKENPTVEIDLSEADLDGIRLRKANLCGANFNEANLFRANFIEANLTRATFINAYCIEASFSKADLRGANFSEARLDEASFLEADLSMGNLEKAILYKATFSHTNLTEANLHSTTLEEASLMKANLTSANLSNAKLSHAYMYEAELTKACLIDSKLYRTDLGGANLPGADLTNAEFVSANLSRANLTGAKLINTVLWGVNLYSTDLTNADLTSANLQNASLVETNLENAILSNCKVYGISVWNLKGVPKDQSGLVVTPDRETEITVDDLQVAQFIYLLLKRESIRKVFDTITSKAILILGRFTPERKAILEAIADELRKNNLLPIIFDFERSPSRDFTETIKILAGLSLFVIVDITNPKSAPLELQATIPDYQIPFIPIIKEGEKPFAMFSDLKVKYDWVLEPVIVYQSKEHLLKGFKAGILDRGWEKHKELQIKKTAIIRMQSIDDFVNKTS